VPAVPNPVVTAAADGLGVPVARAVLAAVSAHVISWPACLKSVGEICPGLAAGSTISSADWA
jgi:hypothetical protein